MSLCVPKETRIFGTANVKQRGVSQLEEQSEIVDFLQVPSMNISKTSDLNLCLMIPHSLLRSPHQLFHALPPQIKEFQIDQLDRLECEQN